MILRQGEKVLAEAQFHWSQFILTSLWAFLGTPGTIMLFFADKQENTANLDPLIYIVIFWGPLAYKLLSSKMKRYVVTDQRLFIQEGILARRSVELPISKINDVSFKQGLIQRLLGSGDILVMTGNPKPTILKHIDSPETFREALGQKASSSAAS